MSTKPSIKELTSPPADMVTPIMSLYDVGALLVEKFKPADGVYDVVVEYKFGPSNLRLSQAEVIGAMAVSFGGVGLRRASADSKSHQRQLHVQDGAVLANDLPAPPKKAAKRKKSA